MSHSFGWLQEQASEDALHAERLLFVEERPFQRVFKRLLAEDSTLRHVPKQLPTPPPEGDDAQDAVEVKAAQPFAREKFWEDVLIDFAALQSSVTRIQLIHSSNERERERYASEKTKIMAAAQAVRENTVLLRAQLVEAQSVLELRKGYDELASKILDDEKLKSRDEATQEIIALDKEIKELRAEGGQIESLWVARRAGFERVVEEGRDFIRVIKGVKDHPEEADKADEDLEQAEDDTRVNSEAGTPRPMSTHDSMTPRPGADNDETENIEMNDQPLSRLRETELASDAPTTPVDAIEASIAANDSEAA